MSLRKYLSQVERTYKYRIKTVRELNEDALCILETYLMKYDPVDFKQPKKLMFQTSPLDFPQIQSAEVWVIDVELSLPASTYELRVGLARKLFMHLDEIVIRAEGDAIELEVQAVQAYAEMDADAEAEGLKRASVLTDPNYEDAQDPVEVAGQAYNSKFLNTLAKVAKEQPYAHQVDAPHPLSVWKDQPEGVAKDMGEFNKDIAGAPHIGDPNGETLDIPTNAAGANSEHKRSYKRRYGKDGIFTTKKKDAE